MKSLFNLDLAAVESGGEKAGEYLDRIGKTDIGALSQSEWREFCIILVSGAFDAAFDQVVQRYEREGSIGESLLEMAPF
jgi:hypothetical protein